MAREGQHQAQVTFKGDAGSGVKAAKEMAAQVAKLEGKVAKLEQRNQTAAKSTKTLEDRFSSVKGQLVGAAGLIGGAVLLGKGLHSLAERGAQVSTVMQNLPFSIDKAQEATMGFADAMTLGTSAVRLNRLGIVKSEEDFAKFSEIATKLGVTMGVDAAQAADQLTSALANQSKMRLDNLGITIDQDAANLRYAITLGKDVEALTDQEKAQAFANEALRVGGEVIADVKIDEHVAQWNRLNTALKDFADNAATKTVEALTLIGGALVDVDGKISDGILEFFGSTAGPRTNLRSASEIQDLGFEAGLNAKSTQSSLKEDLAAIEATNSWLAKQIAQQKKDKKKGSKRGRGKRGSSDLILSESDMEDPTDALIANADFGRSEGEMDALQSLLDEEVRMQEEALSRGVVMAQRRVELAEQTGNGVVEARRRELDMEMALAQWRVENAGTFEEQEQAKAELDQITHEQRILNIREEMAAEQEMMELRQFVAQQSMKLAGQTAGVIGQAAELGIVSQRKAAAAAAVAAGVQSLVQGFLDTGRAASAFASFNYVQGALYATSAGINFVSAGLSFAQAAKMGGAGGAGGGGRKTTIGKPRGSFGGGQSRDGDQGLAPSGAPQTGNNTPQKSGGQQPMVGTQLVFNGPVNGSVDKDFVIKFQKMERDVGRERRLAG